MKDVITRKAIAASIDALNCLLREAAHRSTEAHDLLQRSEYLAAMGAISGIDRELEDALALYRTAITLHRRRVP